MLSGAEEQADLSEQALARLKSRARSLSIGPVSTIFWTQHNYFGLGGSLLPTSSLITRNYSTGFPKKRRQIAKIFFSRYFI